MLRNQCRDRIHRIPFHQSQHPINNQPFSQSSKHKMSHETLQKNRTFSHKKLTLASSPPSSANYPCPKKMPIPNFEPSKFYKQTFKSGNFILQQKKNNVEDGKISLKLGIEQNGILSEINNSNQSDSKTNIQYISSQCKNVNSLQNEIQIKNELSKIINSKFQLFMLQINHQSNLILELKYKIEMLENQLKSKNHLINNLILQKNAFKSNVMSSQEEIFSRRLTDVAKILQTINVESNRAQVLINQKLELLTKELVQLTISNNSVAFIRNCLDGSVLKLNSWLTVQQAKIRSLQSKISEETFQKIKEISNLFKIIYEKVTKLEEQSAKKQTKNNENKELFDDFVLNNDQNEIQNHSIFGNDDYFFHPNTNNPQVKMKSSSQSSNYTRATTTLTSVPSSPSSSNIFINVDKIINHLKLNHENQLPLQCSIDKHNRIVIKKTNKLLQNQLTRQYFKVNEEQIKILQTHNYIFVL